MVDTFLSTFYNYICFIFLTTLELSFLIYCEIVLPWHSHGFYHSELKQNL